MDNLIDVEGTKRNVTRSLTMLFPKYCWHIMYTTPNDFIVKFNIHYSG